MKKIFFPGLLLGMNLFLLLYQVAAAEDRRPQPSPKGHSSPLLKIQSNNTLISGRFRLGKAWCEELKPFPASNRLLLVVELTVEKIWLHIDEEDQRVSLTHAEEVGPAIYCNPYAHAVDGNVDTSSPVTVIGTPGTPEGERIDPRSTVGGVFIDFKKMRNQGGPPLSLEKFTFTLFEKEFNTTYLKPGQKESGFLYFLLPWTFDVLSGMQLHLEGFYGEPVDIVLSLPD